MTGSEAARPDGAPEAGDPLGTTEHDEPLASALLLRLRDYWETARGDRPMPARRDLDPVEIPRLLSNLLLIEVHHDGPDGAPRFRYRLIGTAITRLVGREATGRWIDESLYGERLPRVLAAYRRVVETRAPLALRRQAEIIAQDWIFGEFLLLPLGETDDRVDMILAGMAELGDNVAKPEIGQSFLIDWRLGAPEHAPPPGPKPVRLPPHRRM